MSVSNMILRVRLRNGALINFDQDRIENALYRAADSIGGFRHGDLPAAAETLFDGRSDREIAAALANMVTLCLNSNPQHHVPNFPPDVEKVQDTLIHVLRSYGFIDVADVYEAYRWGRHWVRQGAITPDQFVGNGFPEPQIAASQAWNQAHDCDTVEKLNHIIKKGKVHELVSESIRRYEGELDQAVEAWSKRRARGHDIQLVIVAGPSSSGKTTTTLKVRERLMQRGVKLFMMNLDDYFWPVNEHPTDWTADRDYETPDALDYNLINAHLHALLKGETIRMPRYDFHTGERLEGPEVRLPKGSVLLLDCLHGLYPPMTAGIPAEQKFKIYLETLNVLYAGDGGSRERVRFTDVRMIRRICRDSRHRNHPPLRTILHWNKVRKSELANIIPLIGSTDAIVNGGLAFDLPALKPSIEKIYPAAGDVKRYERLWDAVSRFRRVKELLDGVEALTPQDLERIPGDCVIREFIGGGTLAIPHNE